MAIGIQNQYFGTEIEMTGITRQRAAEAVAELFGTRAVYDGGYYQTWSVIIEKGKNGSLCMMAVSIHNAGSVARWFMPEVNIVRRW